MNTKKNLEVSEVFGRAESITICLMFIVLIYWAISGINVFSALVALILTLVWIFTNYQCEKAEIYEGKRKRLSRIYSVFENDNVSVNKKSFSSGNVHVPFCFLQEPKKTLIYTFVEKILKFGRC